MPTGLFISLNVSQQAPCTKTSSETCLRRTTISLQVKQQHKTTLKITFQAFKQTLQAENTHIWNHCDKARGRMHTERKWEGAWRWRAVEFSSALYFPSSPGQSALPLSPSRVFSSSSTRANLQHVFFNGESHPMEACELDTTVNLHFHSFFYWHVTLWTSWKLHSVNWEAVPRHSRKAGKKRRGKETDEKEAA